MAKTAIYSLRDELGIARYVGKTTQSLRGRLDRHLSCSKKGKTHRDNWIRSMEAKGLRPRIDLIEMAEGDGKEREIFWIATMRSSGWPMTNTTDGGEGGSGIQKSEETREKIRAALTGKTLPEETKRKISMALKGRPQNPRSREGLIAANTGRPLSAEHRKKISAIRAGMKMGPHSAERCEKMRAGMKRFFALKRQKQS